MTDLCETEYQELDEEIRQKLINVDQFDALLQAQNFLARSDAKAFCMDLQGRERNKALRGTPEGKGADVYTNGSCRFSLSCKDLSCRFKLECQQTRGCKFHVFLPRTNLEHGSVDPETGEETLCNVEFRPNAKEVSEHPLYKSQRSAQPKKRIKGAKQTAAMQQLLAVSGGCGPPAVHAVKTANSLHKDPDCGVPCMHAIMFLKRCGIRSVALQAHASHFYPWCLNSRLRLMLQGVEMSVPLESAVVALSLADPTKYKMLPKIKVDNVSSKSSARIASVGETGDGSGDTLAEVGRKRKAPCPHCHVMVSGKTNHLAHTCNNNAGKKGIDVLNGFNLTIVDDRQDPPAIAEREATVEFTQEDLEFTEGLEVTLNWP